MLKTIRTDRNNVVLCLSKPDAVLLQKHLIEHPWAVLSESKDANRKHAEIGRSIMDRIVRKLDDAIKIRDEELGTLD